MLVGFMLWAVVNEIFRPGVLGLPGLAWISLITASAALLGGWVTLRTLPNRRSARALYVLGPLTVFICYSMVPVVQAGYPLENAFIAISSTFGAPLVAWGVGWWALDRFVQPTLVASCVMLGVLVVTGILVAVFHVA